MFLIVDATNRTRTRRAVEPIRCRVVTTPERRIGRFSDGIERTPRTKASNRVGRFSQGSERLTRSTESERVGTFADGIARNPETPASAKVGSFGDGYRGRRGAAPRRESAISAQSARPRTHQTARGCAIGSLPTTANKER